MFNIKKFILKSIFILTLLSLIHINLESKSESELNIYSGRKLHLIDPLIKEFFPRVNSCEFLWRLDKGPIKPINI